MSGERITKAQRLLDLIACLHGRRTPMTVEQIFEAVPAYRLAASPAGEPNQDSVRRMFERDKDELRGLGIPIDTVPFPVNYGSEMVEGYQLRSGTMYLPYVKIVGASGDSDREAGGAAQSTFTREELETALEALREAAEIPGWPLVAETRLAYRKLSFDLGSVPEHPAVLRTLAPGAEEIAGVLPRLVDALSRRKRIEFRYHGLSRGEPTDRDVAPYGMVLLNGTWYLVGHDALRAAVRMFHVGRIGDLRVNRAAPASADYEIPDDFRLSEYGDRSPWTIGGDDEPLSVRVRFAHPLSLWAARNELGERELDEGESGAVHRFDVRHVRPFLGWILGLRGDARIVEPVELADELRELAAGIEAAHG